MTSQEVNERYLVPTEVLREYERWELRGSLERGQYSSLDLERLSLILTLRDIGFSAAETESYMRLTLARDGGGKERLRILEQKRRSAMDRIHCLEKQVARMDCLRHQIKTEHKSL